MAAPEPQTPQPTAVSAASEEVREGTTCASPLRSGCENHDGFDLDSVTNALVEDSIIASEDDSIAIKSGEAECNPLYPSANLTVRNITSKPCSFLYIVTFQKLI